MPPSSGAPQRRVQTGVARSPQPDETSFGEGHETGRNRRIRRSVSRWCKFRDDFASIGHQNCLSRSHVSDVLAQTILQLTHADGLHWPNVASGGYIVNAVCLRDPPRESALPDAERARATMPSGEAREDRRAPDWTAYGPNRLPVVSATRVSTFDLDLVMIQDFGFQFRMSVIGGKAADCPVSVLIRNRDPSRETTYCCRRPPSVITPPDTRVGNSGTGLPGSID